MWKMRHAQKAHFLATSRASEKSLLLGSHLWEVHNDSAECSNEGGTSYIINMTLHACNAEQFACDNAFCISMGKRCDALEDCMDGSDEHECEKLIIRKGYKKELTPILNTEKDVVVNVSINILDIEIYESTETFTTKISLIRDWFDGRLMFKHLKNEPGKKMNTLFPTEITKIWFPFVVFNNARKYRKAESLKSDIVEVVPNKNFTYMARENMHIFVGSKHTLSKVQGYNVDWKYEYGYQWYPFDTQVCRREIVSLRFRTELIPTNVQHNRNIYLNCYTLRRMQICKSSIDQSSAIIVEITLGRPIINNLLTVFVPTILLVIISFIARFFAEDYIDMVVQVNLTILLVLATM